MQPRTNLDAPAIIARALTPDDAATCRELRLEALTESALNFRASYDAEAASSLLDWAQRCTPTPTHFLMGIFVGSELIGMSEVSPWMKNGEGHTAFLSSSYIAADWRGLGIGTRLFAARLKYAARHTAYRWAIVAHRDGNLVNKRIIEKYGGVYWRTTRALYADGTEADRHWYRLLIPGQIAR